MVRDGGLGRAILIALVLCGQACQHTTVSGVPDEALVGLATLEAATSIHNTRATRRLRELRRPDRGSSGHQRGIQKKRETVVR